jgi:hypothetical protein
MITIIWTEYLKYRSNLRGFDIQKIEDILRYSDEKYFDNATYRMVAVGNHNNQLVMIPYEKSSNNEIIPVTIHATSRQQINYRLKSGRFTK